MLALLLGCSQSENPVVANEDPQNTVTPIDPLPQDCLCWCRFPPHCPLLVYPWILETSQGNSDVFDVSFDVNDYRMMPWSRWIEDPVEYIRLNLLYDPSKLELLEINPGIDTADEQWWMVPHVEPWYQDKSLNIIAITFSDLTDVGLRQPILPPVYLPNYGESYKVYRIARFTFRRIGVGNTVIKPIEWFIWQHHYSSVKVLDPLYLSLSQEPTKKQGVVP